MRSRKYREWMIDSGSLLPRRIFLSIPFSVHPWSKSHFFSEGFGEVEWVVEAQFDTVQKSVSQKKACTQ